MSSEWIKMPLEDLLELVIDHRGKTPNKMGFDDFHSHGYPVLSAKHVKTDELVNLENMRFSNEEMYKKWMKIEVQEGDIVLTSEAPMGEVFYLDGKVKYLLGQRVFGLRPKSEIVDPLYLAAWLSSRNGQQQLSARASGSTVIGIKQSELLQILVDLPPKWMQAVIAKNRRDLSKKIEVNKQINQTLEAMAQAIFKSWFVDFEPVKAKMSVLQAGGSQAEAELAAMMTISGKTAEQLITIRTNQAEAYQQLTQTAALFPAAMQESELGEIPEEWSLKALGDICTFSQGSAFKIEHQGNTEGDYPFIKVSDMNLAGNEVFILNANNFVTEEQKKLMNAKVHPAGSTVFAKIGVALTSNRRRLLASDTIIDNNLMSVSPIQGMSCSNYLYITLTNLDFNLLVSGTALPYLNVSDLRKIKHIYSSREIITRFESITSLLFSQIKNHASQNNSLVNIRDSLLPKLLSGELEV